MLSKSARSLVRAHPKESWIILVTSHSSFVLSEVGKSSQHGDVFLTYNISAGKDCKRQQANAENECVRAVLSIHPFKFENCRFLPSVQEENVMSDSARLFGLSALVCVSWCAHTQNYYLDGSNSVGRTKDSTHTKNCYFQWFKLRRPHQEITTTPQMVRPAGFEPILLC